MKKLKDKKIVYIILVAAFLTAGCASYYKIADPVTGNLYYAEKVEREGRTAVFKDARSGALVRIQNSEVSEVSKKDFQAALKTPKVKENKP
jgi:hypothetical protein